jgi:hypothetical protein
VLRFADSEWQFCEFPPPMGIVLLKLAELARQLNARRSKGERRQNFGGKSIFFDFITSYKLRTCATKSATFWVSTCKVLHETCLRLGIHTALGPRVGTATRWPRSIAAALRRCGCRGSSAEKVVLRHPPGTEREREGCKKETLFRFLERESAKSRGVRHVFLLRLRGRSCLTFIFPNSRRPSIFAAPARR